MAIFGLFGKKRENANDIKSLEEFASYSKRFVELLQFKMPRETIIKNWERLISNEESGENKLSVVEKGKKKGLMEVYNKKWNAFIIALESYKILSENAESFTLKKKEMIEKIKPLYPKFAIRINEIELSQKNKFGIEPLNEIAELNKYVEDLRRWPNYRPANRIEFFIQRLQFYLNGGKDEITGETYLGLTGYFKDGDLARELFKIPQIKKLWTYKQEIVFFDWSKEIILKSIREEGKWEGFYAFYNNLRKGKKYINMVRDRFGNLEFAEFLERVHEKIHEAPAIWEEDLKKLSYTLHDLNYQNTYVIVPAQQALTNVFNQRIKELQEAKEIIQKKFLKLLAKTRRKLIKEIEEEQRQFNLLMANLIPKFPEISSRESTIYGKGGRISDISDIYKNLLSLHLSEKLLLSEFKGEGSTTEDLTKSLYLSHQGNYTATKIAEIFKNDEKKYSELLPLLKDIIKTLENGILPSMDKLISHINSRLPYFKEEIKVMLKMKSNMENLQIQKAA